MPHTTDFPYIRAMIICMVYIFLEGQEVNESKEDIDRMEFVEGDHMEEQGGWTEVEINAPREFQPKVLYKMHIEGKSAVRILVYM